MRERDRRARGLTRQRARVRRTGEQAIGAEVQARASRCT